MQGKTLGRYRIEEPLGSGGMGTVWLARDDQDRRVAVKVIHSHLLETPGFFKRFLREAEIGQAVRHPNVVRCFDADAILVDGRQQNFLVMEYVEGQTLRDLLEELERVPEELCRHIGREIAKGLAAIHEAGVVHRDIKPENVLITPDHEIKVMDLGVARLADQAIRLSQTGAFVGSIHYAAPEQFRGGGEDLDGRADLHALGLILYELSSGNHPYLADDVPQVLRRVLEEVPRRLGELNPQLSAFFEEVAHTLIAKDREKRFASATELQGVLETGEDSTWWRGRAHALRVETKQPLRRIRIPRETAVYGREDELAKLRALFDLAKGGDGQVVLIEGEAGIGKSRLVDELIGRLRQEGEELNFLFGSYPPGGAATAAGAFSTAYREQIGGQGAAEYLRQTLLLVPAFEALLNGNATPEGSDLLTKDSIQTCFVSLTRGLAAERTTVVLIDDLHFAPEEGRALFTAISMAVPDHKVLLIGTLRPGVSEEWVSGLTRLEHSTSFGLDRLREKDLLPLLRDCFHSEHLATELVGRIALKSDGNPFFVFEIIQGLREEQRLTRREDGTWRTTEQIREITIPSSVRDLIAARVADLDETDRDLLELASCCGYEFDPSLVARALDAPLLPTLKQFARIEYRHQLVHSAGRRYRFDHHQVQEVLYARLFDQIREQYHAALALALEAREPFPGQGPRERSGAESVELCEHFFQGAMPERALATLDDGIGHLEEGYLHDAAAKLADRALVVPGLVSGTDRLELLLRKARSLDRLGSRRDEQRATLGEAVAIAGENGEPIALANALTHRGRLMNALSEWESAKTDLTSALTLAREAGDLMVEAAAARALGHVHRERGRMEEARTFYERGMEIARELGDAREEAYAAGGLGLLMRNDGRYEEAIAYQERDLAIVRELGDRRSEAMALGNLGVVYDDLDRMDEARECQERCLEIARETGDRKAETIATFCLGGVLHRLGDLEGADKLYERCRDLSRDIGFRLGEAVVPGSLALISLSRGRLAESLARCREHLEKTRELDNRRGIAVALENTASLLGLLGQGERAAESAREAIEMTRRLGRKRLEGSSLSALAEILERTGDADGAAGTYQEALALRRQAEDRGGVADTLASLGRLEIREGRAESAREHLLEALTLAAELDLPDASVLCSLRLALTPGGDPAAAERAWEVSGDRLDHLPRMEANFLRWSLLGESSHLEAAHQLLRHLVDHAPEEYRESMIENVPLHREIMAAWEEREE